MAKAKSPTRFLLPTAVLAVVVIGGLGIAGIGPGASLMSSMTGDSEQTAVQGPKVKRGPLVISVTQRGNLAAKNSIQIRNELEGRTTILSMIAEGTQCQKGDLLVELDVSNMEERRVQQGISVANARASYKQAVTARDIQVSQNLSDVERAKRQKRFAEMDKDKYIKGDWKQATESAEEAITLAMEELKQAQDRLTYSVKLNEEGFLTRTELETDQLTVQRRTYAQEQANRAKTMLVDFEHPKQLETLDADIAEAARELDRVELQADARLEEFKAAVITSKARLDLEEEEEAKIIDQISKGKIVAPEDGIVVYARQKSRWGSGDPIAEGTELHERQEIITIPREGGMILEASLHETVIKKVKEGQRCTVTVDAMPGRTFDGEVNFVALLPDSNSYWANPNQRLFKTEVAILNPITEMRPGMSCKVEILVDIIENAIQVPVQTVFRNGGKTICFVDHPDGPKEVAVKVGRDNDKWVEIVEGLSEGQTVMMAPPTGFKLEAAPANSPRPERMSEEGAIPGIPTEAGTGRPGESGAGPGKGVGTPGGANVPAGTKGKRGQKPGGPKGETPDSKPIK